MGEAQAGHISYLANLTTYMELEGHMIRQTKSRKIWAQNKFRYAHRFVLETIQCGLKRILKQQKNLKKFVHLNFLAQLHLGETASVPPPPKMGVTSGSDPCLGGNT